MALFNIELRTENRVWDTIEVESENHTGLRVEVARFVGDLLKEHANQIWTDEDWRVDVTGEGGIILYVMHVSAVQAAAARRPHKTDV